MKCKGERVHKTKSFERHTSECYCFILSLLNVISMNYDPILHERSNIICWWCVDGTL